MQASKEERDDLTKITGIGPARQSWLAEVFGARTYDDLAALSADDIKAQLKAESKPYSRGEIDLWPPKAAELAAKAKMGVESDCEQAEPKPTHSPSEKVRPEAKVPIPATREEQWRQIAFFNVEFQERRVKGREIERRTRVNYHETDQEVVWPGFQGEQICQWITERLGDKLRAETQEAPAAELKAAPLAEEALPGRLSLTVTGLRLYQPAGMEAPLALDENGRPDLGVVNASSPFAVEARFEIGEQAAAVIEKQEIPYQVQFYAHNRSTGDKAHLGSAGPGLLFAGKASYSAMIRAITLPPGIYRLQVVVILEAENVVPGYLELPLLRVQ
jgi:hypothetical protein